MHNQYAQGEPGMSVSKKLAPYALSAGLFGLVASAAVIAANGSGQGREVELVRPASVVSTPSTTTSTTPVATPTTTATQEDPVKPDPTPEPETTTAQEPAPKPTPSKTENVDPATIGHEDYAPDDPRRQERPPVAERYNSTGAENGIVVPLPGETAEPRPDSPTPSATTSATP